MAPSKKLKYKITKQGNALIQREKFEILLISSKSKGKFHPRTVRGGGWSKPHPGLLTLGGRYLASTVRTVQSGPKCRFEKVRNRHDENVFPINEYSRVFDKSVRVTQDLESLLLWVMMMMVMMIIVIIIIIIWLLEFLVLPNLSVPQSLFLSG